MINSQFTLNSMSLQRLVNSFPQNANHQPLVLKVSSLETELGTMIAIADHHHLYLLEFMDCLKLESKVQKILLHHQARLEIGVTDPLTSIALELDLYFQGILQTFQTSIAFSGTSFQNRIWQQILKVPYGQTRSYLQQAMAIGQKKACRAVANAHGANPLVIVIPCHRMINHNGQLGGYAGGIWRKKWLMDHEARYLHHQSH